MRSLEIRKDYSVIKQLVDLAFSGSVFFCNIMFWWASVSTLPPPPFSSFCLQHSSNKSWKWYWPGSVVMETIFSRGEMISANVREEGASHSCTNMYEWHLIAWKTSFTSQSKNEEINMRIRNKFPVRAKTQNFGTSTCFGKTVVFI